ncbi:unnamed protein product, partial [Ectocarpus sp. 8 AP-2014]
MTVGGSIRYSPSRHPRPHRTMGVLGSGQVKRGSPRQIEVKCGRQRIKAQAGGKIGSKDPLSCERFRQVTISIRLQRYELSRRIDCCLSQLSSPYTETSAQITTSMTRKAQHRA